VVTTAAPLFNPPPELASKGFACRPESEADLDFLLRLYASTREREMALAPWTPAQKAAFLTQQFYAQRKHYRGLGETCAFLVLERDGEPVGRLYLNQEGGNLHLVDISLLPPCRRGGVGSALLRALQARVEAEGKVLRAFVEKTNPARRLYQRLGFAEIDDQGLYMEIEWSPAGLASSSSEAEGASGS
jgi:ribosomal protein S18 acetylase RimI-like enzyme